MEEVDPDIISNQKLIGTTRERQQSALMLKQEARLYKEQTETEEKPPDAVKRFTSRMIMKLTGSFFQSILTIFACVVYVVDTYYEDDQDQDDFFWILEIIIAGLFSIDYAWGMMLAKDKKKFMLSLLNIIDLLTILPVYVALLSSSTQTGSLMFTRIIRVIRIIRILRLYRLFSNRKNQMETSQSSPLFESSQIKRQILIISSTIVAMLFISTGVVHSLQKTEDFQIGLPIQEDFTFDTAFYYMIITISTVGYGDMSPSTIEARAIIGLFIIVIIVIITQQTSSLSQLMKRTSPYRKPYKTEPGKHVVVTGKFNGQTLYRFLKELYHPDHDMPMRKCKVLLVQDEPPSKEILAILNHPIYEDAVTYLQGDFLNEKILQSASVQISLGVFILTNQYQEEITASDTAAILYSSAVKEYSPETTVFLQVVKPDLLIHHHWAGWETGFSTWNLKLSLLAANVFTPGFSTFISNLVISSSGTMKKEAENNHWLNEYIVGLSNELYLVSFPEHLIGSSFSEVCKALYLKHNCTLIGIQTTLGGDSLEILMNPVQYTINNDDKGFIIAPDIEDARAIQNCMMEESVEFTIQESKAISLKEMKTESPKKSMSRTLEKKHYNMWQTDFRGVVFDHILVFGRIQHLEIMLSTFNQLTNQLIFYVNDQPPGKQWDRITHLYKDTCYLQCTLTDITEISHTAINFAYHVILLSTRLSNSSMEDSGILPVVSIIENNFQCRFTVELVDEVNMKYLENRPLLQLESLPYITWPRYSASTVFFSSALDYFIAQGFHNIFLVDMIQRMIVYQDLFSESGFDQNYRFNGVELPQSLSGEITFGQIFQYFISLERPVIAVGIYRGVGFLNNEVPYVYTKPDPSTPLFKGDTVLVMGELNDRINSSHLKGLRKRERNDTMLDFSRQKSITKRSKMLSVKTQTPAQQAVGIVTQEEKQDNNTLSDEDLLNMVKDFLENSKREREMLIQQNQTIMNLASEYTTVQGFLQGDNFKESFADSQAIEFN